MKRREFIVTSCLAGAAPLAGFAPSVGRQEQDGRQYFELRHYHQPPGSKKELLELYLEQAAIPALNRLGIGPVGVFTVRYGPSAPSLFALIPHPSLESIVTLETRLLDDAEYMRAGAAYHDTPLADPAYIRQEKSLLLAFKDMPKLEAPPDIQGENQGRILELRVYESHSEKALRNKIEMFNEGGEIQIFRDTGLHPVFFGETVIGPRMPNLTYMLWFKDMTERDKNWETFVSSPAWKELSSNPKYPPETVSNITDYILRPTGYSQV